MNKYIHFQVWLFDINISARDRDRKKRILMYIIKLIISFYASHSNITPHMLYNSLKNEDHNIYVQMYYIVLQRTYTHAHLYIKNMSQENVMIIIMYSIATNLHVISVEGVKNIIYIYSTLNINVNIYMKD